MANNVLGYRGTTYKVPASDGWNANPNIDSIPPESLSDARNINLHKGGRSTRGGTAIVNSSVITDTPQIMGGYQFRKKSGNEFIITATANGKIQKDYTTQLKDSLTINKYTSFETFNDTLYICNGADRPQTWDGLGVATTNISGIPSDWSGVNFPMQIIKHGKGVSESLWAILPSGVYASKNGTDDFTDANVNNIPIETGDGIGIVGAVEFGDNLICFGKKKAYIIDDSSSTRSEWGYTDVQWDGGAAHARAICKTPNDLIVFDEKLELYSISAVQTYGDYATASLTRPAFINRWIDDNIDKTQIDKFHITYDSELRALKWFVVRNGETQVDTALVLFIDKGAEKGWVQHRYAETDYASCSFLVRVSAGNWKIYTGGYSGYVYQLETATFNDNGLYFYNGFTTPYLTFDNARITKHYPNGWLVIIPQGSETITVRVAIDGYTALGGYALVDENGINITDENGIEIWGNSEEIFQVTATTSATLQNLNYFIGSIGNRIQVEVYNETINTSFFVAEQLFDFEALESRLS